jgi:hypothetical protein
MAIDPEFLLAVREVGKVKEIPDDAISIMTSWLENLAESEISKEECFSRLELLLKKLDKSPVE